jgi:hypothetical protein
MYRRDLATIHHLLFGSHADACAPPGAGHRYEAPAPARFVRHITPFTAAGEGSWRRDDERHENVLVDTAGVPALLAAHGVEAAVAAGFGDERLPGGMVAVVGYRR